MNRGRKNRNRRARLILNNLRARGMVPGRRGSGFGNRLYPFPQGNVTFQWRTNGAVS